MPLYSFNTDQRPTVLREAPPKTANMPAASQLSHVQGGRTQIHANDGLQEYPTHLEEYLIPGFRALDDAMKHYWSGIRVPTKDSYRFMRVKVAGGDKSLLVWRDDLVEGRVRLPVAAMSREQVKYNPEKFSPPYLVMRNRFLSNRGDQVAQLFRPSPWLIDYNLTVWAERKRDMEYILYQVLSRFNPIAEFKMFDGKIRGNVQLIYGGSTDASDKEAGFDTHAKVRYEITMTAEAWLPLPERIAKTVLGQVTLMKEWAGSILMAQPGRWYQPREL